MDNVFYGKKTIFVSDKYHYALFNKSFLFANVFRICQWIWQKTFRAFRSPIDPRRDCIYMEWMDLIPH
jgi:hypothetical protein